MEERVKVYTAYHDIPYSVIATELKGSERSAFQKELGEILDYYSVYESGCDFVSESGGDYEHSNLRYRKVRSLINKEARFFLSSPPDITITDIEHDIDSDTAKSMNTLLNKFLGIVLKRNGFNSKLLKAAKDCFIGKRVACMLNFNPETGIEVTFLKATEFLYVYNGESLEKFVAIYKVNDSENKVEQVYKKKSYIMENGFCYVEEKFYNGSGVEILKEDSTEKTKTLFTRIPAYIIFNDGLTNDASGESEVEQLQDYEQMYSNLGNADIDSEKKNMNPILYTTDASAESSANLALGPGAYWDLQSDDTKSDPKTVGAGVLNPNMAHSGPLKTTLDRIDNTMHDQIDVPNITSEQLSGVITSGKTISALYWSLTVRCNEKMLAWGPAIEYIADCIIEGAILYPESAKHYMDEPIPSVLYTIKVENNYPLPSDTNEEKTIDLAEVAAQTMSRKSYIKKWRNLTDKQVDEELKQIALERQMLEDSMFPMLEEDIIEE